MKLSAIDLNLLLVLHTVLQERTVARAAAKLHVTPPAISNALARLRELVGDPLLVRHGRGLVPTPRALELAPTLGLALGELERALDEEARFEPLTTRRRFVLACSDSDQLSFVPRLAARFHQELPRAQFQVVSIDQLTATDGLAAGSVDAAVAPAGASEALHTAPLYDEEAVLVVRRDHPMRRRRPSAADFNALRHVDVWLVLGRAGVGNSMAEAFFERHGLHRQVALIVPGFAAAAMAVVGSDLAAAMPRRAAEALARVLPLRVLPLPTPPMRMELQLIWHARTHADPGAVFFRDLVFRSVPR